MVALPHLIFLAVLGLAALIAWPFLTDRGDTPLVFGQAVLLGLIVGGALSAVIP